LRKYENAGDTTDMIDIVFWIIRGRTEKNVLNIYCWDDKLEPGGGYSRALSCKYAEMPVFDHSLLCDFRPIRATMGDSERIVGADSLILLPFKCQAFHY